MKGTFQFEDGSLNPCDEATRDILKKLRRGQILIIDVKRSRNPQFHRRAFALLRILYDMVDTDLEFNPWRKWLTISAGFYTSIGKVNLKGITSAAVEADSLSFEKMDDEQFRECWTGLHRAFSTEYGDKLSLDELMEWSVM